MSSHTINTLTQSISHMQLWQLMSLYVSQETRGRANVDAHIFKTRVTMQLGYVALYFATLVVFRAHKKTNDGSRMGTSSRVATLLRHHLRFSISCADIRNNFARHQSYMSLLNVHQYFVEEPTIAIF